MERIILALDVGSLKEAERFVDQLRGRVGAFKVGFQLFAAEGPRVVQMIRDRGERVFLDLKFHDIPNTVAGAVREACKLGVFLVNLHASGGPEMMRAAVAAAQGSELAGDQGRPKLLAVTVLTSLDQDLLTELAIHRPLREQVVLLARLAQRAGMDGVVASPQEIQEVRAACGPDFLIVTPGVRPSWASAGDQKRTLTPREAVEAGADYLVIGRPILAAPDPIAAADRIIEEIEAGSTGPPSTRPTS